MGVHGQATSYRRRPGRQSGNHLRHVAGLGRPQRKVSMSVLSDLQPQAKADLIRLLGLAEANTPVRELPPELTGPLLEFARLSLNWLSVRSATGQSRSNRKGAASSSPTFAKAIGW